ncbi:MAG: tyrosine-type recombinase/integrase [bacterium]|nr:tyrosine-type recombinase/integrase [bacterium]
MVEKSFSDLVTDFLVFCELDRNYSQNTIRMYSHYLNTFTNWLQKKEKSYSVKDIDETVTREFRLYLSRYENPDKGFLKRSTQNYFLIAIRAFLKYLTRKGLKVMPSDRIELGKMPERMVKFLDHEHVNKLINMPDTSKNMGLRDKAIIELLFSTGLRVSELTKLNVDQINLDTREMGIVGKGGHARVVFISDRSAESLSRYLTVRQEFGAHWKPLFIRFRGKVDKITDNGEKMRLTVRSVERMVGKYAVKAGIPVHISPHTLRHSLATSLLSNGADLRSVQEILGHKNVATTQIYTHVTNTRLREVFEKYHDK